MTLTQMRYFYEVCKWRSITNGQKLPPVCISLSQLFPSPWPIWKKKAG